MDIYAHVMPAMQRDAAERMDALLLPLSARNTPPWLHRGDISGIREALQDHLKGHFTLKELAGEEGFEPSIP